MPDTHAAALPRLVPFSRVRGAAGNARRGQGDVLIENAPYGRVFHSAVVDGDGAFLYDLPTLAEPAGAIALPVDRHLRVGLIRHWRPVPTRAAPGDEARALPAGVECAQRGFWSLEVPRGFPDPGEKPMAAACREAQEELGVSVVRAMPLGSCNLNTSVALGDIPLFAVLAMPNEKVNAKRDASERIAEIRWLSAEQVMKVVANCQIRCGLTMAALLHFIAAKQKIAALVADGGER